MSKLPKGWAKAPIGTLCDLVNGKAFRPTDWSESGLPIIRIQNLNNPNASFNHYEGEVEDKFLVSNGDLLFAWSGTPGTSFGAHTWNRGTAVLNQHIFKIVFNPEHLNRDFFRFAINQKLQEFIEKAHGGAGLRHITRRNFEDTEILLPPKPQQDRIAARLADLLARNQRARTELLRVSSLLDPYRRAILEAAFSDRFIRPSRTMQSLAELVDPDRGIPYGIVQTAQPSKGGVPTVRAGDIKGFAIDKSNLKLVNKSISNQFARTIIRGGEVLISIRGTVGNAAVATKDLVGCNLSREVALIPVTKQIDPWYLTYFLSSPTAQSFILGHVKGVAQSGINLHDLRLLQVPVLDLATQHKIVHFVNDALGWLSSVKNDSLHALTGLDVLDEATLAKAFKGELVAFDPSDEPATMLLSRILADREDREARRGPRPRRAPIAERPNNVRKGNVMGKKRADVGGKYLSEVLTGMGGSSEASSLWQLSEMDIDEFYKQLRVEVRAGLIREGARKEVLERTNAT